MTKKDTKVYIVDVVRLAFPSILSMVSITIQNFIDTAFISHVGKAQVAAVGLITWYIWTILSFFRGLTSLTNTFVARYLGGRRYRSIGFVTWHFVYLGFFFGIIYFLIGLITPLVLKLINPPADVSYHALNYTRIRFYEAFFVVILFVFDDFFKGIKRPTVSMVIIGAVSVLNILLDYILIFGHLGLKPMGVRGAAVATVLAEFTGFLLFASLFLSKNISEKYKTRILPGISISLIRRILKFGFPAGVQNVLDVASFLIFGIIIAKLGTDALAINQIVVQILSLTFMPGLGFSRAATTMVSSYMGEGNIKKARKSVHISTLLALSIMMPVAVTFITIPQLYLKIFTSNEQLISIGKKILLISAAYEIFDAIGLVYSGGLVGAGDTKFIMWSILITAWGLFLPFTYLLGIYFKLGIIGAWLAMALYIFIFGILAFIRFAGSKWEKIKL